MRRLGYDQAHTLFPQILQDGRIVSTRWEYNDRVSGKVPKLFVMNPDGTAQTEFYDNNSHSPRSIIHARQIPGSQRLLVIGSGHHTDQSGTLMRLDRSKGTQEDEGLEYVAPLRAVVANRDDFFGQQGELFQYPLPIDEDNYPVSVSPEGGPLNLFHLMYRIPLFGRPLELFAQLGKDLGSLAEPILNFDNHDVGSCGRTLKHICDASMLYPGALFVHTCCDTYMSL